jgi:hypothetical protein
MGIQVEFNPDLALRAPNTNGRAKEECLPSKLELDKVYSFLKKGQRLYYLEGQIPLVETKGSGDLSRPLASITIIEATHYFIDRELHTVGKYIVHDIYDLNDPAIHFEAFQKR